MTLILGFVFFIILGLALHPAYFVVAGLFLVAIMVAELDI